jgi:hypothetical protein
VHLLGAELDEVELGRRLFELTAAARAKGLDPEGALRLHAGKVMREVEAHVAVGGMAQAGAEQPQSP